MSEFDLQLLALSPHPDDAELCCGGLIAKLAQAGYRTGIVDFTRGEMGTTGTIEERAAEAHAAGKALGVSVRENLGLPECAVGFETPALTEPNSQSMKVIECIRKHRPELILCPLGDGRHPDHDFSELLLRRSIFLAGLRKLSVPSGAGRHTPRQILWYSTRRSFTPTFIVDVTQCYPQKLASARCHETQLALQKKDPSAPKTLVSSPLTLPSLEARDRYFGSMIGVEYGEGYILKNALPMSDPVAHFRTHDTRGALMFPDV